MDSTRLDDHAEPWRKSSFSGASGACVQLRRRDEGLVEVRDSKRGAGSPVLEFTRQEITALVAGVCAGEFDDLLDGEQVVAIRALLTR